jgi:ankyrin repeat protein
MYLRFLLARLYVDSLLDKRTKSKVQITLDALSKQSQTLENAYEDAVKRLRSQLPGDAALATRVLTWIIYAERALTTSELRHALAVELGQANLDEDNVLDIEDIVAVCAGLVTVDKKSDIVRLVHYTTQEYFKSMREDWNPDGQLDITRTCLTYLSFKAFRSKSFSIYTEFKAHFNDYPFLDYAAQYWGTHAVSVKAEVSELARAALLNKNPAPNLALLYASFRGHIEIVKLLLDYGADLSITHAETGWTPLGFAVSEGHIETVKLLLDYGADPDIADTDSWTPLLNASSEGHVEIVKLLLDNGADSSIADVGTGWTPFITAIQRGYREVVELLLPTGIGMNNTVLWLTRRGYTDLLKLSHERHNGDLQIINSHNENLLHVAAKHGQIDTFLFLVGRGLDPLAKDAKGADLLCCVALSNSLELCNIVLNMGILPSTQTGRWTPLHWACKIGNSDVIERLVQAGMESSGVSISNPDRTWYPVDVAIFHGHEDILPNLTHSCKIALGPVSDPDRIVGKVDESKICDGCDQVNIASLDVRNMLTCFRIYVALDLDATLVVISIIVSCANRSWIIYMRSMNGDAPGLLSISVRNNVFRNSEDKL